jgi:hypothetical protein
VDNLISRLPGLFVSDWPLVPNHIDLLENNIHIDLNTGKLMGICDWKDTEVSPFGMLLGGLEIMLGVQSWKRGWLYHANQQDLRTLFWEAFWTAIGPVSEEQREHIEVARLVGLFLANGFQYDNDDNKVPASEGHHELRYLEAVVLCK